MPPEIRSSVDLPQYQRIRFECSVPRCFWQSTKEYYKALKAFGKHSSEHIEESHIIFVFDPDVKPQPQAINYTYGNSWEHLPSFDEKRKK